MIRTFLIIAGIYILYKFIYEFLLPIYNTSKRVQEQFRHMEQQTRENARAAQNSHNATSHNATSANNPGSTSTKTASKDYIDFEEVKD